MLDVWSFSFIVLVFFPLFYIVIDLFVVSELVSNFLLAIIIIIIFASILFFFEEKVFETACYITQAGLKLVM